MVLFHAFVPPGDASPIGANVSIFLDICEYSTEQYNGRLLKGIQRQSIQALTPGNNP